MPSLRKELRRWIETLHGEPTVDTPVVFREDLAFPGGRIVDLAVLRRHTAAGRAPALSIDLWTVFPRALPKGRIAEALLDFELLATGYAMETEDRAVAGLKPAHRLVANVHLVARWIRPSPEIDLLGTYGDRLHLWIHRPGQDGIDVEPYLPPQVPSKTGRPLRGLFRGLEWEAYEEPERAESIRCRRQHPRRRVSLEGELVYRDPKGDVLEARPVEVRDLSLTGAQLTGTVASGLGTLHPQGTLELRLSEVLLPARVVRIHFREDPSVGVSFTAVSDTARRALARFTEFQGTW